MNKKIDALLNGTFEYELPRLMFSRDKLTFYLKAGEMTKDVIYLGTDENVRIRGYITSSNRRVRPQRDTFAGTTVSLPLVVDARGLSADESIKGWLCFTSNIGEYKLPFEINTDTDKITSSAGSVDNLRDFCTLAQKNFREAFRIFTGSGFSRLIEDCTDSQKALYLGLSSQPVTYQHLEEFLVGMGLKDPVSVRLMREEKNVYGLRETFSSFVLLKRSGWGHIRLELETEGDFLSIGKHVITEEDFIGSGYELRYVIDVMKLHRGNNHGCIIVRSPFREIRFPIMATVNSRESSAVRSNDKKYLHTIYKSYMEYRRGELDKESWLASTGELLDEVLDSGLDYPEYHMLKAYLLIEEDKKQEAKEILVKYKSKTFTSDELEFAGVFLALCVQSGLYKDRLTAMQKIESFYRRKENSKLLLWIRLKTDETLLRSPVNAIFLMEEIYNKGIKSPLLYQEAWEFIVRDMSLLRRLSPFWIQVFRYAGRHGLYNEELLMRFAYLSSYEKTFNPSLYESLAMGYNKFETDDILEAICRYIMNGNPRKKEYFPWFSLAVDKGLRLTRVYEYYAETLDIGHIRLLPKSLLMYFSYNFCSTLGESRKAYIYACIVTNKEEDPHSYDLYKDHIRSFTMEMLKEGRINEHFAILYQEFAGAPADMEEASALAPLLMTCRLYCDHPGIRTVVVRHAQMAREETYPCIQGVAYPRIFSDEAVILFQDDQQRRYSGLKYSITKLMEDRDMLPRLMPYEISDPGILLHYCINNEIDEHNIRIFQRLSQSESISSRYSRSLKKRILNYLSANRESDIIDNYLKDMDPLEYARVDCNTYLEILITRSMYRPALKVISIYGTEGMTPALKLKLSSRLLSMQEADDPAENKEICYLASEVFRMGIFDEEILHCLMETRMGPMDELLLIWHKAKSFGLELYKFTEKVLGLLMLTSDYRKEGEQLLERYIRMAGKEVIRNAYLTQIAYGIFVKEYSASDFVIDCLKKAYQKDWNVDIICHYALLKELSRIRRPSDSVVAMEKKLLKECADREYAFAFYKRLPLKLLQPYHMDDKTFLEYHASPGARVILHYAIDSGLGEEADFKTLPLKNMYEGIVTKTFTLFYGETLRYYYEVEENGKTTSTSERTVIMNKTESSLMSKYHMLNQLLSARKLGKNDEVIKGLRQYLRQDQYVKDVFTLQKEE